MGRGRAKAKQTRVARDLKYRTFDTDFSSLERELRGSQTDDETPTDEEYADYAERYESDEVEDDDDDDEDAGDDLGRRYG